MKCESSLNSRLEESNECKVQGDCEDSEDEEFNDENTNL